jgi:cytidyltransferase-like protein
MCGTKEYGLRYSGVLRMKYSLFIGRYQPFHEGHKKLIETVLNEGKNVCIALRDTPIDENNPYRAFERIQMVQTVMKHWGDRVKVIVIPDIEEVCYGRGVGWGVREIKLDAETESISATKIRASMETK